MATNVCPPDNDPPPCANSFVENVMAQRASEAATNRSLYNDEWSKEYSSPKRADVYLKLGQAKSVKLIKYNRGRKDTAGNYIYSLSKKDILTLQKYSGPIEVMKIFIDAKRKINNFKSMYITLP